MSYITTSSGKHFDPVAPDDTLLNIRDIAHALSLICRANGHVRRFYSVAQHSIACCREAEARGLSARIQYGCLLHDASEAYLSDVTRPIKSMMTEYLRVEDRLQSLIWQHFVGTPFSEEETRLIFGIDDDMLSYEFLHLMPESVSDDYKHILSCPSMDFVQPEAIEEEFVSLASALQRDIFH